MATIGLDSLFYSKITEDERGEETYAKPKILSKAISADVSVELAEASLFADDGESEVVKLFKNGKISLNVDDIGNAAAEDLTGAKVDNNGALVSTSDDTAPYVAIGFRALKSNGKYRYFWFYKVKFSVPSTNLQTKGDSINFSTPTIEGSVIRRNKVDGLGKHPWKVEATEGATGVSESIISSWFNAVYEPAYAGS